LKYPYYKGDDPAELRNFLYDYKANFRLLGADIRSSSDRVVYAVSCLGGIPKTLWVKHIAD
jgi:hypothetical protein